MKRFSVVLGVMSTLFGHLFDDFVYKRMQTSPVAVTHKKVSKYQELRRRLRGISCIGHGDVLQEDTDNVHCLVPYHVW